MYSHSTLRFIYNSSIAEARMSSPARLFKKFRAAATNERIDLNFSWRASKNPLKKPYRI